MRMDGLSRSQLGDARGPEASGPESQSQAQSQAQSQSQSQAPSGGVRRASRSLLIGFTLCLGLACAARGQIVPQDVEGGEDDPSQILMLAPREFQQRLKQAERAIESGEFSDAIESLEGLLQPAKEGADAEGTQEDFFLGRPGELELRGSLRGEARRLLGKLPAAGKELYRLQYGAAAQQLLDRALQARDVDLLSQVSREYFQTPAGFTATLLLAQQHLDQGQGLAAAMYYSRLADDAEATAQFDPELSVQLARSWLLAGQPGRAEEVLRGLRNRRADAELVIAGRTVKLFGESESPLEWLQKFAASTPAGAMRPLADWSLHRGVPSRNPVSQGSPLLPRARWRVPIASDPDDENLLRELTDEYREEGAATPVAVSPLVVRDVVLLRTPEHLLAVDFQTGKRIWLYPWAENESRSAEESSQLPAKGESHRAKIEERLWLDSVYGQITSDGDQVFLVDELPYATADGSRGWNNGAVFRQFMIDPTDRARSTNYLVALDIRTQGKKRWEVGGATGADEPKLANAFFLGAPLVLGNDLFVLAEVRGDISLFVLDSSTGKYRWSQQLAHVGAYDIGLDSPRRLAGASPSYADGVLVCPTSAGAVVAVDVASRVLLWGQQYPRGVVANARGLRGNQFYALAQQVTRDRWTDSTALLGEGVAVLTPPESDQLYCLDLLTGKQLWSMPRDTEWLYTAALQNGHVVLVGKTKVASFRVQDGKVAWERTVVAGEGTESAALAPSGRGFLSGHSYYLPLSDRLLQIDIRDGKIVGETLSADPLGHLVAHDEDILSLSPQALVTFHQLERLKQRVEERLAAAPDDPWGLEHRALLRLQSGEREAALADLREAYRRYAPRDGRRESARLLLQETLLDTIEAATEVSTELLEEADRLIDRPLQRERYLRLVAQYWMRKGDAAEAFNAFQRLASTPGVADSLASFEAPEEPLQQLAPGHQVRRSRVIRAGLKAAFDAATPEQRAAIEPRIESSQRAALESNALPPLREFLELYADHPTSRAVRLKLAQRHADAADRLEAEAALLPLLQDADAAEGPEAWRLYARVLQDAERWELAADAWERLQRQWPEHTFADQQSTAQLIAVAAQTPQLAALLKHQPVWQYGRVRTERLNANPNTLPPPFQSQMILRPLRVLETSSPLRTRLRVVHDGSGGNSLIVQDRFGNPMMSIPSSAARGVNRFVDGTMSYRSLGHLLMVNLGHTVVAVDALHANGPSEEHVRWPSNFNDLIFSSAPVVRQAGVRTMSNTNAWGQLMFEVSGQRVQALGPISSTGAIYAQSNLLHCVDPVHGEVLWTRQGMPSEPTIWGDDRVLFVADRNGAEARVYRTLDGVELGRRPLPAPERRWATRGRHLLTWDDVTEEGKPARRLKLWDALDNTERWARIFPADSKGTFHSEGLLAIVDPTGRLTLLDAASGDELVSDQLEESSRPLQSVQLIATEDQFLVMRGFQPQASRGQTVDSPDAFHAPLMDGDLYAYARNAGPSGTGPRQWQMPAVIEGYGLPLDQPEGLPVLAFLRQSSTASGRNRRPELAMLCIDRRDGRLLLDADRLNFSYGTFFISGDPGEQVVSMRLSNLHHYQLHFTDEPQAPEPAAQTGSAASRGKGPLSRVFGAALNAVGRGVDSTRPADENNRDANRPPVDVDNARPEKRLGLGENAKPGDAPGRPPQDAPRQEPDTQEPDTQEEDDQTEPDAFPFEEGPPDMPGEEDPAEPEDSP